MQTQVTQQQTAYKAEFATVKAGQNQFIIQSSLAQLSPSLLWLLNHIPRELYLVYLVIFVDCKKLISQERGNRIKTCITCTLV